MRCQYTVPRGDVHKRSPRCCYSHTSLAPLSEEEVHVLREKHLVLVRVR
jgi:hypothetical protein